MKLEAIVRWFETLTPESVREVGRYYAPEAYFKDPFNEVAGAPAIGRIFAHMFEQLEAPRFRILERWEGAAGAMLTWEFRFRFPGEAREQVVPGATHLRFAPDGRIASHRDYWDAAEELYAKRPGLGWLMRGLRERARA